MNKGEFQKLEQSKQLSILKTAWRIAYSEYQEVHKYYEMYKVKDDFVEACYSVYTKGNKYITQIRVYNDPNESEILYPFENKILSVFAPKDFEGYKDDMLMELLALASRVMKMSKIKYYPNNQELQEIILISETEIQIGLQGNMISTLDISGIYLLQVAIRNVVDEYYGSAEFDYKYKEKPECFNDHIYHSLNLLKRLADLYS